ncbi:early lactation protein-like [Petromyzon marinus]
MGTGGGKDHVAGSEGGAHFRTEVVAHRGGAEAQPALGAHRPQADTKVTWNSTEISQRLQFLRERDACRLPMSEGDCDEHAVRWFYHLREDECQPFIYGGCGGNANRFDSEERCVRACRLTPQGAVPAS